MATPEMQKQMRRRRTLAFHSLDEDGWAPAVVSSLASLPMGGSLGWPARLANPPSAAVLPSPLVSALVVRPCRTPIRTAVLKPLGNRSRSRMMTWRRLKMCQSVCSSNI